MDRMWIEWHAIGTVRRASLGVVVVVVQVISRSMLERVFRKVREVEAGGDSQPPMGSSGHWTSRSTSPARLKPQIPSADGPTAGIPRTRE